MDVFGLAAAVMVISLLFFLTLILFSVKNFETNTGIDLETTCKPDIVFYVLPYMRIYPKNMEVDNLPVNILYAYIPYGEFVENDLDDALYNFGWNERIWRNNLCCCL